MVNKLISENMLNDDKKKKGLLCYVKRKKKYF